MKKMRYIIFLMFFTLLISGCGSKKSEADLKADGSGGQDTVTITVPNVVNENILVALQKMEESGFSNISSNLNDYDGWDKEKLIVVSQSVAGDTQASADTTITLNCKRICKLYFDLSSEYNLIFNTYDVEVKFDGESVGKIANGATITTMKDVLEGKHELVVLKDTDNSIKATKSISVNGNMTFSTKIKHGGSIELSDAKTTEGIIGAEIDMPDVTGMVLYDAMNKLSELGFINVHEEPYAEIWNRSNWIVQGQSIEAGTVIDKNQYIQLDANSFDSYYSSLIVGKNAKDIIDISAQKTFGIRFEDESWNIITDKIYSAEMAEREKWIATKARKSNSTDNTAVVTLKYTGVEKPENTTPKTDNTTSKTDNKTDNSNSSGNNAGSKEESVSYSTNTKSTVKNGNSGVYAYSSDNNYIIVDFDEGYYYWFQVNDYDTTCDKVKITSGDLNSVMIVTYHDGSDVWQYGVHFKWKNQPDHLVLQDYIGNEFDFTTTNLEKALKLRDARTKVLY